MMDRFDEFEFSKNDVLGHGAFAIVYKGRYIERKDVPVAVKVILKKHISRGKAHSDEKKISLLEKEIKILKELSDLKHENLVSLLKCHEVSNAVYLVMEFCNAGDLADYLTEKPTLPEVTIQHFLRHMAFAIEAIYKMGIVHRDLKPQNMLLYNPTARPTPPATDLIVKLADFGFARFLHEGVMAATLCGSPMYMAPEVLMSHKYCAKADLWSLGTIIFQCLSGKPPFQAATPNELREFYEMNRNLEPKIPAYCSPLLKDILLRLLKRDAKDRMEFDDFFHHAYLKAPLSALTAVQPTSRVISRNSSSKHRANQPSSSPIPIQMSNRTNASNALASGGIRSNFNDHTRQIFSVTPYAKHVQHKISAASQPKQQASPAHSPTPFSSVARSPIFKRSPVCDTQSRRFGSEGHFKTEAPGALLRQIQVHSGTKMSAVRALPVPNQAQAFVKMEQKRLASAAKNSHVEEDLSQAPSPPLLPKDSCRLISIENISLPATQFVIRDSIQQRVGNNVPSCTAASSLTSPPPKEKADVEKNADHLLNKEHKAESKLDIDDTCDKSSPKESGDVINNIIDNLKFLSTSPSSSVLDSKIFDAPGASHISNRCSTESGDEEEIGKVKSVHIPFGPYDPAECAEGNPSQSNCLGSGFMGDSIPFNDQSEESNLHDIAEVVHQSAKDEVMSNFSNEKNLRSSSREQIYMHNADSRSQNYMERDQLLAKLQFVIELVDSLINVAEQKDNPIVLATQPRRKKETSDVYRRAEQLVVYVRALHMLSSALLLAQRQIAEESVKPSVTLQQLLNNLNEQYHKCLVRSQELVSLGLPGQDPAMAIISAERIMYKHAMELCQAAAMDELVGRPNSCPQRYQTAYMMLHTLSEQVSSEADKLILSKYKAAVEKRLRILEKQGFVQAVSNF